MELIPLAKKQTQDGEEQEELSSGDSLKLDLYFWLQALVLALVALILLFTFVGRIIGVDGSSMYPTLHHGDMLLLQSVGYEPKQGDVVVLTKAFRDVDGPIVKRVIAVGGQTVDIDYDAGTVAVDGQVLDEPYIHEAMLCPTYEPLQDDVYGSGLKPHDMDPVTIPEDCVFVMGDNRNHSNDSRDVTLGTVDERYVLGRAVCVLLPFQNFGMIPEGEQTR